MDTFTHHICANGHGGTIGTGFPYIRRVDRRTLAPVQYIVLSSLLRWQSLLYSIQPSSQPFYKVSIRPSLLRVTLHNRLLKIQRGAPPAHQRHLGRCWMMSWVFCFVQRYMLSVEKNSVFLPIAPGITIMFVRGLHAPC